MGAASAVTAGVGATVGDTSGIGVSVGSGIDPGVGVGIGTNPSSLSIPSAPTSPTSPKLASVVADMSGAKLARMKKRCADVLSSQETYDRDLRQLCLLIARR
ncbi:hypothetical protein LB543_32365 [Mesorhizobium sp. ESP7-2]|uniref:hypothetical protein n=1 Tax=Mesorhizobium sp. ESP7-2 TaxID=2876622 RepID=UPI001CC9C739|nr:hypothetical protein [Mesorhizobium sp. ESP7-2]MBZ9711394.1 hypothetical protein [Mesorhizobium sp. ESP7-2]